MFHKLALRGQDGRIKVGYQTAAILGPYSLTPCGPHEWTVNASVKTADAFWLSQTPRLLEVQVGAQRWRWPADRLVVDGATITGTVSGRPERR